MAHRCTSKDSAQFVQVNLWIPDFGGFHQLVPGDFVARVRGGARHHARERGLRAFGGLIVKTSVGDALDEGFLFFGISRL